MRKLAVAFIGTAKYFSFFPNFYARCMEFLACDCEKIFLIFTDMQAYQYPGNCILFPTAHEPWPYITLKRFEFFLRAQKQILSSDFFLFLDADMLVNTRLTSNDLFCPSLPFTGVQHPAFYTKAGTFETNPRSTAYVPEDADRSIYWQGCLWGGQSQYIVPMLECLSSRINDDLSAGIVATWHDESHLNRFFIDNKALVKTLDPGFAFPEISPRAKFAKKIIHLNKSDSEFGNRGAGAVNAQDWTAD